MVLSWFIGGPSDGQAYAVPPLPESVTATYPRRTVDVLLSPPSLCNEPARFDEPIAPRRGRYELIAWDCIRRVAVYHYEGEQ